MHALVYVRPSQPHTGSGKFGQGLMVPHRPVPPQVVMPRQARPGQSALLRQLFMDVLSCAASLPVALSCPDATSIAFASGCDATSIAFASGCDATSIALDASEDVFESVVGVRSTMASCAEASGVDDEPHAAIVSAIDTSEAESLMMQNVRTIH
jgi:hypothetical protein